MIDRRFVSLESATSSRAGAGGHPCQGVYHSADARPRVGFIATHYEVDFSEHYLASYLAARGFGFLGWNTRYRGNGAFFLLEHALIDIGAGVRWLREEAGVETVVLLGNSGGASLMAAYRSQTIEPIVRAAAGLTLPDAVRDLPPADLFVSLNAHPGRPDVLTAWIDPSVVDERDPRSTDPSLDMFANSPPYDAAFVDRYRAAQRARNHRISAWCRDELIRGRDHVFCTYRTWADLRFADLTIDPSERKAGCYMGDAARANTGGFGIAQTCTLRSWLSMWSLEDSQCGAVPHLSRITDPALVVQSTADRGCFPSDARVIFDALGSEDKRLAFVPGEHYFEDGGRDMVADLIAGWVKERT